MGTMIDQVSEIQSHKASHRPTRLMMCFVKSASASGVVQLR